MQYYFSQNHHNNLSQDQNVQAIAQPENKKSLYKLVIKRRELQLTKSTDQQNQNTAVEVTIDQDETSSNDNYKEQLSQIKSNEQTPFQSQSRED